MSKRMYRFFGGLLSLQEKWLNKMAANGYRLIRTGKVLYEFEECDSGQYQYRIDFVGHGSKKQVNDYVQFLESLGYQVFFKNINLNYSIGKVRWRPWAKGMGQIATTFTTYNRELLIVEKEHNGKAFELHTTYEDKRNYYKELRRPWLFPLLLSVFTGVVTHTWGWGIFAGMSSIPLLVYQNELAKLKKQSQLKEW